MNKLNLKVTAGSLAKADDFNAVTSAVDEVIDEMLDSGSLIIGAGLTKSVIGDKITVSLDTVYLQDLIKSMLPSSGDIIVTPKSYNILTSTYSYVSSDDLNNWYDFTNVDKGIIVLQEPANAPIDAPAPNFGTDYIPGFVMQLSRPLNLEETPVLNVEAFSLNKCPFELRFRDYNGKMSDSICIGKLDGDSISNTNLLINTVTHQDRKSAKTHLSSMFGYGYDVTYGSTVTAQNINDSVANLINTYSQNGNSFDSALCGVTKVNLLDATGVVNSGYGITDTGIEDAMQNEEGFDATKITEIIVQMVEWSDKGSFTWKARNKAVVFNKFEFTQE